MDDAVAGLEALRRRFLARVRRDLATLGTALDAFERGDRPVEEVHAEMRAILHRLAGSAGSFGWPEIGARAAELEELLGDTPEDWLDPLMTVARWRSRIAAFDDLLPASAG